MQYHKENNNIFLYRKDFIERDPRKNRPGYPSTLDTIYIKCSTTFDDIDLKGKSVLDLGACVGSYGYWCEYYGASEYIGIDIFEDHVSTMNDLFKDSTVCEGIQADILEYIDSCERKFDIVVLSGVLYTFLDYYGILKNCAKIANEYILIETLSTCGREYVEFFPLAGTNSPEGGTYNGMGSRISKFALDIVMKDFGMTSINTNHNEIKKLNSEFSSGLRYIARYKYTDTYNISVRDKIKSAESPIMWNSI